MEKIVYCDYCCEDVEFEVRHEIVNAKIGNMKITYPAIVAFCKNCKNEMSVPEINDLNIIRAYQAQKDLLERENSKNSNDV